MRFTPDRVIDSTAGSTLSPSEISGDAPSISVTDAVSAAARHVAEPDPADEGRTDQFGEPLYTQTVDVGGLQPVVRSSDGDPERSTLVDAPPFEAPVRASLIWFDLGTALRLGWAVDIGLPGGGERYTVIVDAENAEILYCRATTSPVAARGNVSHPDGGSARVLRDLPLQLNAYPVPAPGNLPDPFPRVDWISTDRTEGNNVIARLNTGGTGQGVVVDGVLTFDPADAVGNDQLLLSLSYFCNFMHDFLYLLHFREGDRNFQQANDIGGGLASDRVDAIVHPGAVFGTANMSTPPDGAPPTMNMGLVTSTNRHTALDSSVVFHEYAHGLSNRLVGGGAPRVLSTIQARSLGEGWSDYIACTINDTTVVGAWIVNSPGGIRMHPYDANYPDRYGMLGTGRFTQVHNNGEIWCAALIELNRLIGAALAAQLVVDGLKLTPANPTYLQARDAVLLALENKAAAEAWSDADLRTRRRNAWQAFAKYGMGVGARSGPSDTLTGIVGDDTVPPEPPETTPDRMAAGERLQPGGFLTSENGRFTLRYQRDGNLVLYRNRDGIALWSTRTAGIPAGECVMQGDGNFVVYTPQPTHRAVWNSVTAGNPGSRVIVQDDGNLVVYRADNVAVWATNTVSS
ncbi:M36 family metallopeptidase [Rhizohabitans arisaemae]|uniref:M36 family metallopeptidase n=1 Tax=Rhizohabitans arisaemae TaxID=2720610 RepID=UPI0024B0E57A|nr:M36 family metallopeptidase [Rhizohabitans arisaemae]